MKVVNERQKPITTIEADMADITSKIDKINKSNFGQGIKEVWLYFVAMARLYNNIKTINLFVGDKDSKFGNGIFSEIRKFDHTINKTPYGYYLEDTFSEDLSCNKTMSYYDWIKTPRNDQGKIDSLKKRTKTEGVFRCIFLIIMPFLLVAALVFWPTMYKHVTQKNKIYIVNRLTGDWYLRTKYKQPIDSSEKIALSEQQLSDFHLRKIDGNCSVEPNGFFSGLIYNGSDFDLTELELLVVAKDGGGNVLWNRTFTVKTKIKSKSSSDISVLAGYIDRFGSTEWGVLRAKGMPID